MTWSETTAEYRVPDDYAREYLAHASGLKLSDSSKTTYESHLRGYVVFLHDGELSVIDAEFTDVIEFVEECVRRGNRQSTIENKVATISELYKYIRLRTEAGGELSLEPLRLDEIDVSQYRMPEPIEREALSREELRQLFDAFDSYRNRLIAVVAVETGIRNSDLRNLRIQDVDYDNLEIHVHNPKGSKPYDVPISEDLAFELNHWQRHHRSGYASAEESPYVFPSQYGSKLETNGSLTQIIREAASRAGLQEIIGESRISKQQQKELGFASDSRQWHRVTPHTLRHSFITLLAEADVTISYRQLVANHASAETTRNYTHTNDDRFTEIRRKYTSPK